MSSYSYYDPNQAKQQAQQRRDAAMQRLMMIMDQRHQKANLAQINAEREAQAMVDAQKQSNWDNMGSMWSTGAQGASIGMASGPGGAAIGAGAGLLLGGITGAQSRKNIKQAEGDKDYGFWDGLKDEVVRAPTMNEVGSIAMAGGSIGASLAGQHTAANQANQSFASEGNLMASLERGSADPNAVTAGTYSGGKPAQDWTPPSAEETGAGGGYATANATKKFPNQR